MRWNWDYGRGGEAPGEEKQSLSQSGLGGGGLGRRGIPGPKIETWGTQVRKRLSSQRPKRGVALRL